MARRPAAAGADPPLFALPGADRARRAPGRHERAVLRTVRHPASRLRAPEHAATRTALRALAAALDSAEAKDDPYAVAQLARPFRDLLADAGLLPGGAPDDGTGLLEHLGRPTLGDT